MSQFDAHQTILYIPGFPHTAASSPPPGLNGRHFADDIFGRIFLNENVRISINFSLKFVPTGSIEENP